MAVAVDSVGPAGGAGAGHTGAAALSWTHTTIGGPCLLLVACSPDNIPTTLPATATCDSVAMTSLGTVASGSGGTTGFLQVFSISGITAGAHTIVVSYDASSSDCTAGSVAFTGAGGLGTPATSSTLKTATVSPTASGNIVAGFFGCGDVITQAGAPATGRFLNNLQGGAGASTGNIAGATAPGTGSSVTITWTTASGSFCSFGVEVKAAAGPPSPGALLPLLAPGWFPGSAAVTDDPGGIPFYAQPQPADATPAVIIPATPEAAGIPVWQPLPPGWFPGADKVTDVPGSIPFLVAPPPLTPPPAVIFPVPEVSGIADWLPLPPGWFPGASQVTTDPGSIPFYSLPQPQTPPPAPPPVASITGLGGAGTPGGGWFTDSNGAPRLLVSAEDWGLLPNSGAWNSGNYRATFDTYFAQRKAQGYTAVEVTMFSYPGVNTVFPFTDGRDWDGTWPFVSTSNPSSGFNATFWARRDYLLAAAAAAGITAVLNTSTPELATAGDMPAGWTTQQWADFGTFLGGRYKNQPNILWIVGDDYFGTVDTGLTAWLAALRAAGDTHPVSLQSYQETTSRKDLFNGSTVTWGATNAQYSWVYTYNVTYDGVEKALTEASPIPAVWADGFFLASGSTGITDTNLIRRMVWWALSSGSRGFQTGDNDVWPWGSAAAAQITAKTWYTAQVPAIAAAFSSLPGWHLLFPDVNSDLVTGGRGTHGAAIQSGGSGTPYTTNTDAYVTASRTPDGSLAVIYMSHASTITINQSKLGAGYTATWLDPANGATSAATPGSTYNSTAKGSNSTGDADWVLVLSGPPLGGGSANVTGTAAAVTVASPAGVPSGAAAVAGTAAPVTVAAPAGAPSSGNALTGAAALVTAAAPAGVTTGSANITGTAAPVTVAAPAGVAFGGTSGAANVTGQAAPVTVTAPAGTLSAGASITGTSAPVTVAAPAGTLSGSVSVTGTAALVTVSGAAGAPAAAASVTGTAALVTVSGPAGTPSAAENLTGTSALVTVSAPAGTAFGGTSGAANVTGTAASVTVTAPAGTPSAGNAVTGTAAHVTTAGGQGTASVPVSVTGVAAHVTAAAPAGSLIAAANTAGLAALAAVTGGPGTATGGVVFTVGQLSAATAAGSTLTAATAPLSVLTAKDQRTGGSG